MFFTLDTSHLERSLLNDNADWNVVFMIITLDTSHLERSPLNNETLLNINANPPLAVAPDTSHLERSPLNDDALSNMARIPCTLDTSHLERSPLNDDAELNMLYMLVTLDTSHLDRSPLNLFAPGKGCLLASTNNQLVSVTAETSQDPIGPCGPLEQSVGDSFRHSIMAAWSLSLDVGAHTVTVVVPCAVIVAAVAVVVVVRVVVLPGFVAVVVVLVSAVVVAAMVPLQSMKDHMHTIGTIDIGRHK